MRSAYIRNAAWATFLAVLLTLLPLKTGTADGTYLSWGVEYTEADILMEADDKPTGSVRVALIDTGVDASNSALNGRVVMKSDLVNNDDDPNDDNGHGTAMAGIIAEMTKGFNVKIYVYKAFDSSGNAADDTLMRAFQEAMSDGCDVLCFPCAGMNVEDAGFDYPAAFSQMKDSGMTVCIPAGDGSTTTSQSALTSCDKDGVIVVSAIKSDGSFYSKGNTGSNIDVAAPGSNIKTWGLENSETKWSSTSAACAHIAGACALTILYKDTSRPAKVEEALKKTCDDLGEASKFGSGVPKLSRLTATDDDTPEPTADPTADPSASPSTDPTTNPTPEPVFTPDPSIITFGKCGTGCDYALYVDGSLKIVGSGEMKDYDDNGAPWFQYYDQVRTVSIGEGVTSIGAYAFYMCEYITSAKLPGTLTSIGDHTFYGCRGLADILLPGSLTTIGDKAFVYCDSLTELYVPRSVVSIGEGAFSDCSGLTLKVEAGSYADWYTEKYGLKREVIGDPGDTTSPQPTATPVVTDPAPTESISPSPDVSDAPTATPGASDQPTPTQTQTAAPTASPTAPPTVAPTAAPTKEPEISDTKIDIGIRLTYLLEVRNASEVIWSSSNTAVARVTSKGLVTGMGEGKCSIYAYADGRKLQCEVQVHRPELDRTSFKMGLGSKTDLNIKYNYGQPEFKSSNKKTAKVSASGRITVLKKGKVKLTVEVDGYTLKAIVTVTDNKRTYKAVNDKEDKVHVALKKLEIKNKKLSATIVVYNNTGKKLKKLKKFKLSLFDKKDGSLIAAATFKNKSVNIKKGSKQKLTLTFKGAKFKQKYFDLVGGGADVYIETENLKY